jgi:hypothetical protein
MLGPPLGASILHAEITPGNLKHSCATQRLPSSAGVWVRCG